MEMATCSRAKQVRRMVGELGRAEMARLEEVGEQLRRQAADLAAAEYRWLVLLEEFDRGGGWGLQGAKSAAGWLSWACGISPGAARERVRVARALPGLPVVSARMAAGALSFSKVRAITRVATPDNEELLVTYAECATAAQLEQVIRGYRQIAPADEEDDEPDAGDLAHRERRECSWWVDEEGYLRIAGRWPVEEGMLIVNAIEQLAEELGEQPAADGDADAGAADGRADVSAETPSADAGGGRADVSAETPSAAESDPAVGCGDRPVALKRWQTPEPVAVRRADALVAIAEAAAAAGQVSRSGDDCHLVSVIVRRDMLEGVVEGTDPSAAAAAGSSVGHPLLAGQSAVAPDPPARVENAGAIASETARRLACDARLDVLVEDALGRPLGVGRRTRTVPRRLRRLLKRRDRGCRFPGCTSTRHLDAHHIWFWGEGGPTDLDNLVLLCRFHHTLVHEGGFSIALSAPGRFTFHRPDASLVTAVAPAEAGDADRLVVENLAAGAAPTADSLIPDWDGTYQDIAAAVEALYLTTHGLPEDRGGVSAETPSIPGGHCRSAGSPSP